MPANSCSLRHPRRCRAIYSRGAASYGSAACRWKGQNTETTFRVVGLPGIEPGVPCQPVISGAGFSAPPQCGKVKGCESLSAAYVTILSAPAFCIPALGNKELFPCLRLRTQPCQASPCTSDTLSIRPLPVLPQRVYNFFHSAFSKPYPLFFPHPHFRLFL